MTVQVEGHVTPRLESAARNVLQGFTDITVNWVSKKKKEKKDLKHFVKANVRAHVQLF